MSNISTAAAVGKSRRSPEIDLSALTRYLEAEQAKADAATCIEDLLRSAAPFVAEVSHV